MPNTRRRKFSVKSDINNINKKPKNRHGNNQTSPSTSMHETEVLADSANIDLNKIANNISKPSPKLIKINEHESITTVSNAKRDEIKKTDKYITANSSNIDFYNILQAVENSALNEPTLLHSSDCASKTLTEPRQARRDKFPHKHRVKVRSPKRRMNLNIKHIDKCSRSTSSSNIEKNKVVAEEIQNVVVVESRSIIVSSNQVEVKVEEMKDEEIKVEQIKVEEKETQNVIVVESESIAIICQNNSCHGRESNISTNNIQCRCHYDSSNDRDSNHSTDDMCRICHGRDRTSPELGQLISACSCRGTVGRVHVKCLERWLTESGKSRCELCGTRYSTRRVHRYGVPRALMMWVLSQNAKQLMVDSLGIMLMSPLAVLAAWLSGRTLAGLMTQEPHVTPWPLASTFVLACMTLVCYYCWIVSAATRHALGWWLWYRSQYEVRLELQDEEVLD